MLQIKNLTLKTPREGKIILDKVNLKIKENEIHCLLGKNGSGKSSLAKALMGINSHLISRGEILFLGKKINNKKIHEIAKMGMTLAFQEPARFEGLLVRDFLAIQKTSTSEIKKALDFIGLSKEILARKMDDKLSGGERKRIELASVFLMKPKLNNQVHLLF